MQECLVKFALWLNSHILRLCFFIDIELVN